jgi:hypothetical protein
MEDIHMSSKLPENKLHPFFHVVEKLVPIRLAGFLCGLRGGGGDKKYCSGKRTFKS